MLLYSVRCVVVSPSGAREPVKFDARINGKDAERVYDKVMAYIERTILCRGEHAENIRLTLCGGVA